MVRSQKVSSSFALWTSAGNDAAVATTRKAVVADLQLAIQDHQFDSETLEDVILILQHECLCWKYKNDGKLPAGHDAGAFRQTLETSRTNQLVVQLSDCLVRAISPSSHYERELQSKALLSALALLHAQGVRALQATFHDDLRVRIADRFKDLQGVPGQKAVFSAETVRKIQSGYYLCLAAEYGKHFHKAEPIVVSVVSSVVSLLIVGASITSAAMGSGPPNVKSTLQSLESAFKPFWIPQNELFKALSTIQELTRITLALHAYGEAMVGVNKVAYEQVHQCCDKLAAMIIDKILSILNSHQGFQNDIGPKSVYLDYFVAFLNRGPNDLGRYFYQYGLLDCVSQLSGILNAKSLSADLVATLLKIIATSQEASYRWKCTEILMRDSNTRGTQLGKLPDAVARYNPAMTAQTKSKLREEVKVIYELLNEEDGIFLTPASSIAGPQDAAAEGKLSPSGWVESAQPTTTIKAHAQKSAILLPQGPVFARIKYHKAGLSPDGLYAYFTSAKDLYVYRLPSSTGARCNDIVLHLDTPKSEYREAVLSNSFLAVLHEGRTDLLEVYRYGSHAQTYSLIATETFEATSREPRWRADCIAIHEARDRVWIAIGGRSSQSQTISSTIRIYRVDIDGQNFAKHDAYFHRSRPNPFTSDYVKSIAFAPDGRRLVCVTNNNRILVWLLSNNARPIQPPFQIAKKYMPEMNARGATSAMLFQTVAANPYVLCTTSPSRERSKNNGEWSFVSAVGAGPALVPPQLDHHLWRLRKAKAILAGAASPDGSVIALLEESGNVLLMPLVAQDGGGLASLDPITLDSKLKSQKSASPTALRFCIRERRLCLLAVDPDGTVIKLLFQDAAGG
ncbi:hypothetical protein MMC26_002970 [Xylographa opegraphella]|nr:hypothetical protein [Xylographa opegraphella]